MFKFIKMASSGKKGKKNKGTVISLQSFLSNGDAPAGTTQVAKKVRNLDCEDSDEGNNSLPLVYQLPTAPRANRIFDDESIPKKPPFIAYVNNLPFDANEEDIYEFFGSIALVSLRLPRDDGETGRSRGFCYVELENRDDLIHILSLPDPSIKGRRIRIEMSNENEQQTHRQRNNRRFEGFGNSSENRDSANWRRDLQNNSCSGSSSNYDRGFNRDRDRKPVSEENIAPGSWRNSKRMQLNLSPIRRDNEGRYKNYETVDRLSKDEVGQERPKLNLKPRTLPLPEIVNKIESDNLERSDTPTFPKSSGISSEKVFGSAKPVDTAARELEIEERLAETRRQTQLSREKEEAVNDKLADICIEDPDEENANATLSWRRKDDAVDINKKSVFGTEDSRPLNKKDGYQKYNKRIENPKIKQSQQKEGKKDDYKNKREIRSERALPKYHNNQPILHSSNKYSELNDEASD